MKKEFNRNELAAIKRAAASIKPLAAKRDRLIEKRNALQAEIDALQGRINCYNIPIVDMTGYNAEDLVTKDANNNLVFKYPDTIVPDLIPEVTEAVAAIDETEVVDEVETAPADAPYQLPY